MKILCCGSRYWTDIETIGEVLSSFPDNTTIVHGAQAIVDNKTGLVKSGADWICGEVAEQLGYKVRPYPADWSLGLCAGPLRNKKMLSSEHHENNPILLCLAFHDSNDLGKGTKDMVERCHVVGIPVRLIRSKEWHAKNGPRTWNWTYE